MNPVDLVVRGCAQLLTCGGPIPKRRRALGEMGLIPDAWAASREGRIVFVGGREDFVRLCRPTPDCVEIDGSGLVALPGFVDPHTHLPFAGSREKEFSLRLQGATYQQLAAQGLGIQTTVEATRRASLEELVSLCLDRLDDMLLHGTTTVEAKSGYGLNLEDELKQLRALRLADESHPIDIVPTFMGAHEVPREFKDRKNEYISLLIDTILPRVAEEGLAEFFDVFCEEGVFTVEEARRMIRAARNLGLKIKVHADEFASLGGAVMAADEGAVSAEHLIAVSEEGIERLAQSQTAAVLLPAVPFFLMQDKRAPARRLIEAGAAVALATDFNPGSSMTESMPFILQLAVFTMRLGIEEAVNAATSNAAYAAGRQEEAGSLEPGKKMDLILCRGPRYEFLAYHLGVNPVRHVIKDGRIVVRDGSIVKS